jgi:recombination protein RecA
MTTPTAQQLELSRARGPIQDGSAAVDPGTRSHIAWSCEQLSGRLAEISSWGSSAPLTLAFTMVHEAQLRGEPAAWISRRDSSFFPPDVAASGIDLDALPVVRVPDAATGARAADKLLRSGAFALIVLDIGDDDRIPIPLQSRLLGLARKHDAAVLFLTEKQADKPSVGSLVSLRAQASRRQTSEGRFTCDLEVVKDKRRGPGWSHSEIRHGPAGLR